MRRPQPLWFGLLALAGAAVLNLNVDDATLSLEADDATDIDAYVASLSLPRLEGAGCPANDAPCVRKVVADALRAAVEDEAPLAPPRCEANATTSVRLAPKIAGLAARAARRCGAGPHRVAIAHARPSEARVAAAWAADPILQSQFLLMTPDEAAAEGLFGPHSCLFDPRGVPGQSTGEKR